MVLTTADIPYVLGVPRLDSVVIPHEGPPIHQLEGRWPPRGICHLERYRT
jgi:hypothetical protein